MDGTDIALIFLRIVHIGSGVFWAGSIAFLTLILEPHYRRQGPQALRRLMTPLMPVMGPALLGASITTLASGGATLLILGWGDLSIYVTTSWGRAILFGAGAAVAAFIVGDGLVRIQRQRLASLGAMLAERTLEGERPGEAERQQVAKTEARLWFLGRTNFVLVVAAVVAMAVARYI